MKNVLPEKQVLSFSILTKALEEFDKPFIIIDNNLTILHQSLDFPFPYTDVNQFNESVSLSLKKRFKNQSWDIHFHQKNYSLSFHHLSKNLGYLLFSENEEDVSEENIISPLLEASNIFYAKINNDETITWSENSSTLIKETKKIRSRDKLIIFLKKRLKNIKTDILESIEKGYIKNPHIIHYFTFRKKVYAILPQQTNVQFFVLFQDVTKIKEKEQKLQERWKLLRNAQMAAKLINYEYDFIKRKSTWSNEVFKNIGYKPDELAPNLKSFQKLIHPEDRPFVLKSILKSIRKKKNFNIGFRIITKSGKIIWVKDSGKAIYNQFGLPIKASGILQDITVEKRIEDELIRAKQQAEESDILKSTFLANMSHEIRTPLNGILGFAQLLSNPDIEQDKREKYISIINNSGEHLMSIISDVIDIAKIESNQITINKRSIKLNPILKELQEVFKERLVSLNKSETELIFHTSHPDDDFAIETDIIRLRQILNNLIYNAIKFTEKGSVEFGYYIKNSKQIIFYVKDTGLGISREKQKIIFERFRQEDEGHSRTYTGSGLGLTICRSLVELMEGEIWLNSQKGKGSVFYFSLPLTNTKKNTIDSIKKKFLINYKDR